MKEMIRAILKSGGMVSFPYKERLEDWILEAKISRCVVFGDAFHLREFPTMDEAIDNFISRVFTKKNLGLAISGLRRHDMTDVDLDDLTEEQLQALIDQYFEQYFATDYPFAV